MKRDEAANLRSTFSLSISDMLPLVTDGEVMLNPFADSFMSSGSPKTKRLSRTKYIRKEREALSVMFCVMLTMLWRETCWVSECLVCSIDACANIKVLRLMLMSEYDRLILSES